MKSYVRFLLSAAAFVLFSFSLFAAENNTSVVNIIQAQKTEYSKDPVSGGELIVFKGDVIVSVSQGESTNVIRAGLVNYSRERDLLYAEGNVTLEMQKSGSDKTETLTAQSLLFNTVSLEGIFDDGRIIQVNAASTSSSEQAADSTMIVSAEMFGRNRSGTIVFKNGTLTFCDDPNPHWKIRASRIWLLPGNEFAFANALLYVGRVPVLYLPFFYYPKDELIINPVFGYTAAAGYFFQTTTYLIGRKPLDTDASDSPLSFMRSSTLMKQRREGLMLHNLDEPETNPPVNSLKLMADYYTSLGGMTGLEGKFKLNDYITDISFSALLGFSRTLFPVDGSSIKVIHAPSGDTYMDSSVFMGVSLPFRYKASFNMEVAKPLKLSIKLPLYSDAYFDEHFITDRKESMDWLEMLMSGTATTDDSDTNYLSSFEWTASGSYSLPSLSSVQPYISSASITFSSSLLFNTIDNTASIAQEARQYSPARKSFTPSQITPLKMSLSLSGTLFEYPAKSSSVASVPEAAKNLLVPSEFGGTRPDMLSEPYRTKAEKEAEVINESKTDEDVAPDTENNETVTTKDESSADTTENVADDNEDEYTDAAEEPVLPESVFPVLAVSAPSVSIPGGLTYKLSYSISPDLQTQITYPTLVQASDFDWENILSSVITFKSPVKLSSALGYRDNFISLSNAVTFSPVIQTHPVLLRKGNGGGYGYDDSYIDSVRRNDYAARKFDLENTNEVVLKPFIYTEHFSSSYISWNTGIKLIRTEFIGTADNPEWKYHTPEWDDDSFTTHTFNVNLAAKQGDFSQTLLLSNYLPPTTDRYMAKLTLGFPFNISLSTEGGVEQKSSTDESWVLRPVKQTGSISLFDGKLSLSESYSYNMEEKHHDSFSISASAYGATLSYAMSYTTGYDFDASQGWITKKEKEFLASSLSLSYKSPSATYTFLGEYISIAPVLSTEINYNLLKPTSSYFTFSPALKLKINNVLEFTFSSTSRNDVIFRYVADAVGFAGDIPGEKNVFKDLFNSFAFWDDLKRQQSGFKIKSFNLKISHSLHDWDLAAEFEIEPRLIKDSKPYYYDFSPYISLSVVWRPMSSMKTTIADDYGEFKLNPADNSSSD